MRVIVAAVGRPKEGMLDAAIHEYETRAARYWPLGVVEVREERGGGGTSPTVVMDREAGRLRERVPAGATLVACTAEGERWSSEALADWLRRQREQARDVAFLIGGAHGLASALRDEAQIRLSLSPMTFPHELARLMLAEQLYRAGTIVRGEPYHK